jgi:hypothetical protein
MRQPVFFSRPAPSLLEESMSDILAKFRLDGRLALVTGAGRAATFPALVPGFALIIGYLALGVVPSLPQVIGLVIVVIGFRFVVK